MDRGFGKAPQQLELSGAESGPKLGEVFKSWSDEDLRALVQLRNQILEGNVVEGEGEVIDD